jgi:transposase-like protein
MTELSYAGYRFPPEIIRQAIWLYVRFSLSLRDVEDLLAERGITVSYESVRRWVNHFGPIIATNLRRRRPKPRSIWHLDEVYLKIDGKMMYLLSNGIFSIPTSFWARRSRCSVDWMKRVPP